MKSAGFKNKPQAVLQAAVLPHSRARRTAARSANKTGMLQEIVFLSFGSLFRRPWAQPQVGGGETPCLCGEPPCERGKETIFYEAILSFESYPFKKRPHTQLPSISAPAAPAAVPVVGSRLLYSSRGRSASTPALNPPLCTNTCVPAYRSKYI